METQTLVLSILLTLAFVFASGVHGQGPEKQEVLLFKGMNESSAPFYMWTRKNEADLTSYRSLEMAGSSGHRLCYLGGLTVYTDVNYSGTGFFVPYSPTFACTALLPGSGYKSFRFPGLLDDVTAPTLSFYTRPQFIGEQTVITSNQPNIVTPIASVYKTGDQPWTLYLQPNYGGAASFCLSTATDAVVDVASLGLAPGDVKSARMGCTTTPEEVEIEGIQIGNRLADFDQPRLAAGGLTPAGVPEYVQHVINQGIARA